MSLPWRHVHFIGIGGVGMAGLALILRERGVTVSGSDLVTSKNTARLNAAGCTVHLGHDAAHVTTPDLVVYSSAVPPSAPERQAAAAKGIPTERRGEFLARLATHSATVVSIAGSHGKTTVSAMLTVIMRAAGREPGYLVGGDVADLPAPAAAGAGTLLVTEVDESDGTQAAMRSTHAIVVNAEDDHCWSVGGEAALEANFRTFGKRADTLVTVDSPATRALYADHPDVTFIPEAAVPADLLLGIPGAHNRLNAWLAITLAARLGVPVDAARAALASFRGVDRRLSVRLDGPVTVIEDYAHHPTEVRATLAALRERYPQRRLRAILQPHRYERVLRYADAFAAELAAGADDITITPPFSAWIDDSDLADPRRIVTAIANIVGAPPSGSAPSASPASASAATARFSDAPWPTLAAELAASSHDGDVIAILGAGTITDLVPPLAAALTERAIAALDSRGLHLQRLAPGEAPPVVAVLMGGPSREAPVSRKSGTAIVNALRQAGVPVHAIDFSDATLPAIPADTDVVFPALHGSFGEDGQIQALLDAAGLPYVGSPAAPCRVMIDKQATKDALHAAGLPVPQGRIFTDPTAPLPADLPLPLILKPNRDGSSEGLSLLRDPAGWTPALHAALAPDGSALIETYLGGVECTVPLLDGIPLPIVEIRPPGGLYTHDAKYIYALGRTEYHCPPISLTPAQQAQLADIGRRAWAVLGARDLLRVDIRYTGGSPDTPAILEANNLPGFTGTSLVPKAAAALGIPFPDLCLHLILSAHRRGPDTPEPAP